MTAAARWITASCVALAPALGLCGIGEAQGRKLNGPLDFGYTDDVYGYTLSPSGRIVYAARVLGLTQLRSVPLDGSGPTVVLQENTLALAEVADLVPTPDGARVVYRLNRDQNTVMELFSARVDGSQPAIRLHAPLAANQNVESFQLAPDGSRAVYLRFSVEVDGGVTTYHRRIYSVPVDGSRAPVLLSNVLDGWNLRITSDSTRVVFMGRYRFGGYELYSVPIAGGVKAPRRLHPHMSRSRSVHEYVLSPDGARVVYLADPGTIDVDELYSVPVDGSAAAVKLNGSLPAGGSVGYGFQVSPDSTRVAYVADQVEDNVFASFVVPVSGGTPLQLTPPGEPGAMAFSPDGATVVYTCMRPGDFVRRLYSVPADGSRARIEISGAIVAGGNVSSFTIAADSSRAVYLADATTNGVEELYSVPLDGSAAPVRLNPALAAQPAGHRVETDFRLTGTGRVLFRMNTGALDAFDLYGVPLTGSAPAVRINSTLPTGPFSVGSGSVTGFLVDAASGQVLYRADQAIFRLYELFSAPLDGSAANVVRSDVHEHVRIDGDVFDFAVGGDGRKAVYRATEDSGYDFYAVSLRGPVERRRLFAGLQSFSLGGEWKYLVTPDSSRVVYRPADDLQDEPYRVIQLRSVPLDASEAPVTLSPVPIFGDVFEFACTPDSARVVFRYQRDSDGVGLLLSVPANGSAAPVVLTPSGTVDHGVTTFRITPDSQRVVFLGAETTSVTELFAVQASGLSAPVQLNGELVAGGDVADFALSPDGSRVVYLADQDVDEVLELFSVPAGGGAVPVELSTIPSGTQDVAAFQVSPDGSRVVYRADQDVNDVFELYSVPIGGGSAPVELSAITGTTKDVGAFQVSPDSSRVVYLADQVTDGVLELFSVPITGGQAPVKLDRTPVTGGDVTSFRIGARRVVYLADQDANDVFELYSARLDGGSPARKLSTPLGADRDVTSIQLDDDGHWVLFSADAETNDVFELFAVPIDGSRPALRINSPLQSAGPRTVPGSFVPGRPSVLFLADQDDAGAIELYVDDELQLSPTEPPARER